MKVLNLQCSHQHSFEGWFASEDDYQGQLARGLIECPMCADKAVRKLPSAPRLNLGAHGGQEASQQKSSGSAPSTAVAVVDANTSGQQTSPAAGAMPSGMTPAHQAAFLQALRQVVANTEDVGSRFAEQARRMHYGEMEARGIRGQTSVREAAELMEEGIEVMPLPLLPSLKETLQ